VRSLLFLGFYFPSGGWQRKFSLRVPSWEHVGDEALGPIAVVLSDLSNEILMG